MNLLLVLLAVSVVLAVAIITMTVKVAASGHTQVSKRARDNLIERFDELPFAEVLRQCGVDADRYIAQLSLKELRRQSQLCSSCPERSECLALAANDDGDVESHRECPLYKVIREACKSFGSV